MSALARAQDTVTDDRATVHVIDDDVSPREALSLLFPSVGLDVRTYASVQEFLDADAHEGPGCIVLDVRLPGISGLDFQLRRDGLGIQLPVVLMTGHGDVPMSVRAMKAGAVDFLIKPFRDQDLLDAVAVALERDRARREEAKGVAEIRTLFESLTPREKDVMALVTTGLMNKQIAAEIGVSEITVKIHRGHAMRKMRAKSLAELVRMAEALGVSRSKMEPR